MVHIPSYLTRRGPDYLKKEYNGRAAIEPISFQASSGLDSNNTLQFTVPLEPEFLEIGEIVSLGDTEFGGVITSRDIDLKNNKVTYTGISYLGFLGKIEILNNHLNRNGGVYYFRKNHGSSDEIYELFLDIGLIGNDLHTSFFQQDEADASVYDEWFDGVIPYYYPGTYTGWVTTIEVSTNNTILDVMKKVRDALNLNPEVTCESSGDDVWLYVRYRTPVTKTYYAQSDDEIVLSDVLPTNQLVGYTEEDDWYTAYIASDGTIKVMEWNDFWTEYRAGRVKYTGRAVQRKESKNNDPNLIKKELIAMQRKTVASSIKLTADDIDIAVGDYVQIVAQSIGKRTEPQLVSEKTVTIFNGKPTITYNLS